MMISSEFQWEVLSVQEVAMSIEAVQKSSSEDQWCPWCGHWLKVVWIHGHGMCQKCRINVFPCCDGRVQERPRVGGEQRSDGTQAKVLPQVP